MPKKRIFLVCSFVCNVVTLLLVAVSIASFFVVGGTGNMDVDGAKCFRYFTMDSNILSGIAALVYAALELYFYVTNKEFKAPKWAYLLKYVSTTMISITAFTVLLFLGPMMGYDYLLNDYNFFMHILVPFFSLVSFLAFENYQETNFKECFFNLVPLAIYGAVYIVNTAITKTWEDFYQFNTSELWYVVIIAFAVIGYFLGYGLLKLQKVINHFYFKLEEKKYQNLTAYEIYLSRIYKATLLIAAYSGALAGVVFTIGKLTNWFDISTGFIVALDLASAIYLFCAYMFIRFSFDESGKLKSGFFTFSKVMVAILLIFQWNFLNYNIDSSTLWAYAIFFALLTSFFFDHNYEAIIIVCLATSLIVSYTIKEDIFNLENTGEFVLEIACIILSMACIQLNSYFGKNVLVKQLENISDYDPLTMLLNRRLLQSKLDNAIEVARDKKSDFSVLMMDLDDFKKVNDTYGHELGDKVLKRVAEIVQLSINVNDLAFRYGGEEFLVLLRTSKQKAEEIAKDIISKVSDASIRLDDSTSVKITVTIGMAEFDHINFDQDLIALADARLYLGKQRGKNRLVSESSVGK